MRQCLFERPAAAVNVESVNVLAGKEETQIIASALGRLPAKTIWKLSKQEVAAVGGLKNLNISDNVKVCPPLMLGAL